MAKVTVQELEGRVDRLGAIKSWGKDQSLLGVRVGLVAERTKSDLRTWTGAVDVPLAFIPPDLHVGSRVVLKLQLVLEDGPQLSPAGRAVLQAAADHDARYDPDHPVLRPVGEEE